MRDSKLPKRQYTDEFKVEAIRLAESVGGHEAARLLGVPVATVGNWKRRRAVTGVAAPDAIGGVAAVPMRRPVSELEAQNSRLRRELADAKLDVEILRKATVYFCLVSRDEVRMDRESSRRVHSQPAVPGAVGVPHGVLSVACASAQRRALANKALDAKVQLVHRDSRGSYGRARECRVGAPKPQASRPASGIPAGVGGEVARHCRRTTRVLF